MSKFSPQAYERVKAKRAQARAAYIAEHGEAPKRGPKPTKQRETLILHLKFSDGLREFIEDECRMQDYQAFFDKLLQDEFVRKSQNS